ncbi:MAG: RyR domain-containing protein, partial [Pseudomonadota bacterium]
MVHETLRVWAEVRDLDALPSWDDAPQWMQESTLNSVRYVLENPDADGARQHEQWLSKKTADGWCWGETKDPEKKTHPLMIPYDELPNEPFFAYLPFQAIHIPVQAPLEFI